jgi:hypothetical protein
MRIRELIGDWLMNTDIVTEALDRSKAQDRISGFTTPVVKHLVKILKWRDELNYQKHVGDIDDWLLELVDVRINNSKIPTRNDYTNWIIVHAHSHLPQWNRKLKKDYGKLPELRSDAEVTSELNRILSQLVDIIDKQMFNTIEQFIPDDYNLIVNDWDNELYEQRNN